jgi:hypothetical protein
MKRILLIVILISSALAYGQRDLTPNSRRKAFGTRDLRNLNNYGLQFQLGATYMLTRLNNPSIDIYGPTDALIGDYVYDPSGKLGAFGEIGMFHFPKKRSKLSLALKTVLISYYDWGLGFKYFRGAEDIDAKFINRPDELNTYNFSHGNVYARFSIHKNIHFKVHREKSNFFLDNSLGINVDYRVLTTSDAYSVGLGANDQQYAGPLQVQLHYGLGFGFRLKRGAYLIPGVRIPLLGYQSASSVVTNSLKGENTVIGRPSAHWFSSRYWPMLIHVKYMFALEKKAKGCPAVETNDQDKNTQRNR